MNGETKEPAPVAAPAEQPTKTAAKPKARRGARVAPTTRTDCKGDAPRKHTINVVSDVHARLAGLQLAQTLAAGREVPLWPHLDAALAVLRTTDADELRAWGDRAEVYADIRGDDYRQVGTRLRGTVLAAVRTLRVRLRAAGVEGVDVQAVLSAAVSAYLDALVAQGDLVEVEQE
ncbi:hypothetical protein ABT352_33465 [Streptosporangium sp. NPDC000563]|uniref:hypothetical protein n=1 Tax=Streptosporangium sp. NPDC000563 TaxID=3154366 RepID=UPI0033327CC2